MTVTFHWLCSLDEAGVKRNGLIRGLLFHWWLPTVPFNGTLFLRSLVKVGGTGLAYGLIETGNDLAVVPAPLAASFLTNYMTWMPFIVGEGDIDAARALIAKAEHCELFLYQGDQHYFADNSLPWYDAEATALLLQRGPKLLTAI